MGNIKGLRGGMGTKRRQVRVGAVESGIGGDETLLSLRSDEKWRKTRLV